MLAAQQCTPQALHGFKAGHSKQLGPIPSLTHRDTFAEVRGRWNTPLLVGL